MTQFEVLTTNGAGTVDKKAKMLGTLSINLYDKIVEHYY